MSQLERNKEDGNKPNPGRRRLGGEPISGALS